MFFINAEQYACKHGIYPVSNIIENSLQRNIEMFRPIILKENFMLAKRTRFSVGIKL